MLQRPDSVLSPSSTFTDGMDAAEDGRSRINFLHQNSSSLLMKRDHVANVGQELTRCTLYGYELLCSKVSRTDGSVVSALPRFADYYIDEEKRQWNKSIADETKRIISTGWFQPDQSKCGKNPKNPRMRCAVSLSVIAC